MTDQTSAQTPTETLLAYLVMRTDLPSLGLGKSRAQAMHAGNAMTYALMVQPLLEGGKPGERVTRWHAEAQGFGTTLAVGSRGQVPAGLLERIVDAAGRLDLDAGLVVDDTYPYVVDEEVFRLLDPAIHTERAQRLRDGWRCFRREVTGAWLFGVKEDLEPLLARFDLTPHHEEERGRS